MSIELGNTSINKLYLGDTEINKAYLGVTEVFSTTEPNGLLNNLMTYYKFENNVLDSHGSNNGTNSGTTDVTGVIDRGREFNGGSGYVSIPNFIGGASELTISSWVYLDSVSGIRPIVTDWATGTNEYLFRLNGGTIQFYIQTNIGQYSLFTDTLTTGQWYHLVATYDGSVMKTYVNGTQSATSSSASGVLSSSNSDFIGKYGSNYLDGKMDEVGFWERGLSATDVTVLYNSGAGLSYDDFTV